MTISKFDTPELIGSYKDKRRQVSTDKSDWPISTIYDKIVKDREIKLDPEYQRHFVWDDVKASQLIESILMGIPLPTIYLAEGDGCDEVIDGQQRLTTIVSFINGRFPNGEPFRLKRLKELSMLNGACYADLPKTMTKDISVFNLSVITIKGDSHAHTKYDIFERLNKGSQKLTEQEIRNCIYRGSLNTEVKKLTEEPRFKRLFNFHPKQAARMEDAGFILGYLCFQEAEGHTRSDTKTQINRYMSKNRNMPEDEVKKLFANFLSISETVFSIFGENSFRKFLGQVEPSDSLKPHGSKWSEHVNAALSMGMMYAVSQYNKQSVIANSEAIREKFLDLMMMDEEFVESMKSQTFSDKHMCLRIDKFKAAIEECISPQGARLFPWHVKESLFKADPTCKICSQRVVHIDDSHVDHIIRFADGGTTTLDNAQLTHRYCNLKKG